MRTVIETYSPFPRLEIELSPSIRASSLAYILEPLCPIDEQALSLFNGRRIAQDGSTTLADLAEGDFVHLRLAVKLRGGKGGFGTQLRTGKATGRSSGNRDSCRTLDGRRLSSVKEAQRIAAAIEAAPVRAAMRKQEQQDRLDQLNREINQLDQSPSTSKRRIDDHDQFVEAGREQVANVRNAVAEGALLKVNDLTHTAMRKKRKKNATTPAATTTTVSAAPAIEQPVAGPSTVAA